MRASGRVWFLLAAVVVAVAIVAWNKRDRWLTRGPSPEPTPDAVYPLPPFSESAFLNTGPDARFIGIDACKECHRENHQSYLHTAHSRALADLDAKAEPPDGQFDHKPSGRSFRVYRQGEQLRHEEVFRIPDGTEIARMDVPIRYLIGSGNFCRSYLVEIDGFLHESPITWYASRKNWAMSPGYDFPAHHSFERPIRMECLACHAGRVEAVDNSVHRMNLKEQAIGCESCHGPGSLHADFRRAGKRLTGEDDATIVNPGKLPRSRLESVCAVCHLNGAATVNLRGRKTGDFRPGLPLTDFRTDYRFDSGSEQMTVVGHIEQLRRSACYQKSNEMTCLTCHDPHARQKPKDSQAFYRRKCLECHTSQACKLDASERHKKEPADNCMACHMPRGDTDIPHVAFTHHRIGRHGGPPPAESGRLAQLVPIDDVSNLSEIDQKRNLGLAYLHVAPDTEQPTKADVYRKRARDLLETVHASKLRDGATVEGLAEVYWDEKDFARAAAFAQEAIDAPDLPADGRAIAMLIRADCHMRDRQFGPAIELLEKVTRLRRQAEDWRLLGICHLEQNQARKAVEALQQALKIRPFRPDIHGGLADAYEQLGDRSRMRQHQEKARWLALHQQQ